MPRAPFDLNRGIQILHIINNLDMGGSETTLYHLLAHQDRRSFNPAVISLMGRGIMGKRIEALGIRVYALGMKNGRPEWRALRQLKRIVRSLQPQLLQGWMYYGNLVATMVGSLMGKRLPVVWNVRHTPYDLHAEKWTTSLVIQLGARLSRQPARIIYNSRKSAAYHETLGYQGQKRVLISNGFDLTRFAPAPEARLSLREELGLSHSSLIIGLVGNFRPEKDHETFLRAGAILSRQYSNLHFVLAGFNVDRGNALLSQLIRDLDLSPRTHLLGQRQDIPRLMSAFDIASSSSCSEAFPNVIGEAMACGAACVVTDVGDSAWIVGDSGIVVPPRNPEALAKGWGDLLALDSSGRRCLGTQARQRVLENFSIEQMLNSYQTLHWELVRSGSAPAVSSSRLEHSPTLGACD